VGDDDYGGGGRRQRCRMGDADGTTVMADGVVVW
jgi:hypothetical protein